MSSPTLSPRSPRHVRAQWPSVLGLSLAAVAASGCSSGGEATGATCDPCEGGSQQGPSTNPDGIPYPDPNGGYGHMPRSGSTPGSVIANLHFLGYVNGDVSKGLQNISLADYYDPCQKRLKLLHLSVAGVWCGPCNQETQALVSAESYLQQNEIVVLQALSDGAMEGVGATQSDLTYWANHYKMTFTVMLDPGPTQFGGFFNAAAIPWNADVDPRTMELVDAATGWAGDVMTEFSTGLAAVAAKPLYVIPAAAACNDQ
jgi:hypothetical protein